MRLFNTAFENSLHALILLDIYENAASADMLVYMDFITVYAKSFDIGDKNINGDNGYKYGELSSKRRNIKNSLKRLVLDGMIKAEHTDDGMKYIITQLGKDYVNTLDSDYAENYREQAMLVAVELLGICEAELGAFIKENSKSERGKQI